MTIDSVINIAGDTVELVDRRIQAEGWPGLTTDSKDYLVDVLVTELREYIPNPKEVQNVLPFPGMKETL